MPPRPLRALFLANDGASVGHVTRALAIARALRREAAKQGVDVQVLLATTSQADALLTWAEVPCVRLPAPGAHGLPEEERRALAEKVLDGVVLAFAPDVLVVDTFPSGPQMEAWSILEAVPKRVLIRRTVRADRAKEAVLRAGLELYDRIVVPDDPVPVECDCDGPRVVRVKPIVLLEPGEMLGPENAHDEIARFSMGVRANVVVSCGGGADEEAEYLTRLLDSALSSQGYDPVRTMGLFGNDKRIGPGGPTVPLQRYLHAFELAFTAAGYNSPHECAAAGIPVALYARPRDYDDQAARAERFEKARLAVCLSAFDETAVEKALHTLEHLPRTPLPCTGAAETAREILSLCTTPAPARPARP